MDLGINGKVAIVTGGSQGIGKAIATHLAAEGVRTVIGARALQNLQRAAAEIESKTKAQVLPVQADVADLDAVKKLVASTVDTFGGVDILVNNAAGSGSGPLLELTDEDWLHHLNVKLVGYVRCAREVIPHMRQKNWGRIVNIGGEAARGAGGYASGAANSAVVNFTKKLSDELAGYGITVNAIGPTPIKTDLLRGIPPEKLERLISRQAIKRYGGTRDVIQVIDFFIDPASDFVTGQVIFLGGV